MNMSKITFSYRWDIDTELKAAEALYRFRQKYGMTRYIGWFLVALTQFGVVAFFTKGRIGLLLFSTLAVLYWYVFRLPVRRWILHYLAKKNLKEPQYFEGTADEKGIVLNDMQIDWQEITRILSLPVGFVLEYRDMLLFLPVSAFASLEEKNAFAALAKANTAQYMKAD